MKRILSVLIACICAGSVRAQIPMPKWVLCEALEAQCGVAEYTNEKFDFKRLPMSRGITDFLSLRDTVNFKKGLYRADICDAQGVVVSRLGFQDEVQVSLSTDTAALFVSVSNPCLEVSLSKYLAPDASDDLIARTADELRRMRISSEELASSEEIGLLPAEQTAVSYALQYLFACNGIDASPLFSWKTSVWGSDAVNGLIDYCCDRAEVLKIGTDIERFARKAKFSEERIYVCEGDDNDRISAIVFFFRDGKFWLKIGMSQYTTYDSVISVWRHNKKTTRMAAYTLKDRFR